jgi:hypothetical protein
MEVRRRNFVIEFACRILQAGCDFTGCEGIRIGSTRISARTRALCPIQYINSRTALLIQRSRAGAIGSSFDLE